MKISARALAPLLLLGACAGPPAPVIAPPPASVAPAAARNAWPIDPAQSLVTVTVRRGGPLARLGHDHVVASRTLAGYVDPQAGYAQFQFRLDQMTVDETELRQQAGLDTTPSADAIAGTRTNMLTKVLDAERFPLVVLKAWRTGAMVKLEVQLHGQVRTVEVPVRLEQEPGMVAASGSLRLRQSDFGIVPMSVLGGAMVVQDEMELAFRIVARHREGAPGY